VLSWLWGLLRTTVGTTGLCAVHRARHHVLPAGGSRRLHEAAGAGDALSCRARRLYERPRQARWSCHSATAL